MSGSPPRSRDTGHPVEATACSNVDRVDLMIAPQAVDSLDEFLPESLELYPPTPIAGHENPSALLAFLPAAPSDATAEPPDAPSPVWQRRRSRLRKISAAAGRHRTRVVAAVSELTSHVPRGIRAAAAGSAVRAGVGSVAGRVAAAFRRPGQAPGARQQLRTQGARPRKVAESALGTRLSLARQRRRQRIRQALTEAAGRDSVARIATVTQLTPVVARIAAASSARAGRKLRGALHRLAMHVHAFVVHARAVGVTVWNVTARVVWDFTRQVVWPFSAGVALRLRSAVVSLGENLPPRIGQIAGALGGAGRLLHPRSVAVAGTMLALIVIASPNRGLSDMSGAAPPSAPAEAETAAPTMADVSTTPLEGRAVTPPPIVAAASVAEPSVVKPVVAPAAVPAPRPPARIDPRAIQAVLNRYRDAVSTLDVNAVRSVWPDADVSALRKEFAGVEDQNVEFDACRISGAGSGALASCAGVIEFGFRPGDRRPRVERRRWQFTLEKSGASWKIIEVQTHRG